MYPVAAASKTGWNMDVGPHGATSQRKSGTFPITCDCLYQSSLKVSLYSSLWDNAPIYVPSWVRYPKETCIFNNENFLNHGNFEIFQKTIP